MRPEERKKKITMTMKTIKHEEYARLNKALYDLGDILANIGITEFSLSHDRRDMQIDTNPDNIDAELLATFCKNVELMHIAKFGTGSMAA